MQTLPDPAELSRLYREHKTLDEQAVRDFRHLVYTRYHAAPRPMPWRETQDPYRILISEVMLQQTQVERVKLKYQEFLEAFPTLPDLASAPLEAVLLVWQGLGYNRRAIALKRCAEDVLSRFNGCFPATVSELESLPGIGHYTARAVAAFALGIAEPLIETNIRTVFIHFFFNDQEQVHDREIMNLVEVTLDRNNPREWYYALMDFGVWLKQLHPNPGRRSRHHMRQSRFEGSNRQLRSRLLRAVIASPGISAVELAGLFEVPQDDVERNLVALEQEGFFHRVTNGYRVCGDTKKG